MTPSQILRAAADKIEPEGAWTQRAFARHANGNPIGPREMSACKWCGLGAGAAVSPEGGDLLWMAYFQQQVEAQVAAWNDAPDRTQAEVVAALRAAAELAERDEQRGATP